MDSYWVSVGSGFVLDERDVDAVGAVRGHAGAALLKGLRRRAESQGEDASGAKVMPRRLEGVAQVAFREHVLHGVAYEDSIEGLPQPRVTHVASDVGAFWIQNAR